MTPLEQVTELAADCMDKIKERFKPGAKITLLVRTPGMPLRDFCLTDDDLDEVFAAIVRRKEQGPTS
jgi:hypothetical protein